jgi:hypothetical protein
MDEMTRITTMAAIPIIEGADFFRLPLLINTKTSSGGAAHIARFAPRNLPQDTIPRLLETMK